MADQITDTMVQEYRAEIEKGWQWLNAQDLRAGTAAQVS